MSMIRKILRNNEYYNATEVFDRLYEKSAKGENFRKLFQYISAKENILLAYRNIKINSGSDTAGPNKKTIKDINKMDKQEFVQRIQKKLQNYHPGKVRRVFIDKSSGGKRPLGIPNIEDRIIQQCFKQVLEPICEAKFYEHSYGFRPNRSTHHALSRSVSLININKLYYCVDIDIKGFFDNIDHKKLMKQLWSMGIRDKKVLKIIQLMLKAEIDGEGIPEKGVPQGGVLSPLLSNIVLNELDWWIASQFHHHPTAHQYADNRKKFRALKGSNLKEIFIVRYADDFKIFCRDFDSAKRVFIATQKWLKERLNLDCNTEKSKVTNLRRSSTEFLGFTIKAKRKKTTRGEYVAVTHMTESKLKETTDKIRSNIQAIQTQRLRRGMKFRKAINDYNSTILGLQNYFKYATECYEDFSRIKFETNKVFFHKLLLRNKVVSEGIGDDKDSFKKIYPKYEGKLYNVDGITLYPITGIAHVNPKNFSQDICNYTEKGRKKIHKKLTFNITSFASIVTKAKYRTSVELIDKQISLYAQQKGKCAITGEFITGYNYHLHHKLPVSLGGTDEYRNLSLISPDAHRLLHATKKETIERIIKYLGLKKKHIQRTNKYRELAQLDPITLPD